MLDVAVSIGQLLSVIGLIYGLVLTLRHRESAELRPVRVRMPRAERRARHSLRLHCVASRGVTGR